MAIISSGGVGQYRTSEAHWFFSSRHYKPNSSRYGVIFVHGALSNAYSSRPTNIAHAGYPVLCADLCASSYALRNWGNADHLSAITAAYNYLTGTLGAKSGKVILYGASMGASGALAWAAANPSLALCVAAQIPVLDVNDVYQNDKGSNRASIGTAYGVTYPTSLGDLSTHSPVSFSSNALSGIPVKLWASSNDTVASTTASCVSWGGKGASSFAVVDLGAVGHDGTTTDAEQVVAFFDANGGRA